MFVSFFLFVCILKNLGWNQIQTKVIELLFRVMDANGDGFISKVEMLESSPNLTMSQVDAVFRRNDGDSDGKLSKDEFKDMIKRNSRERKITRFHSTESVKSLSMAPLKEERSRSSGGSCSRSIKTSESVKSLSRTPLQERSRSTGGSVRIKTSRSRSAGKSMERRHSESRIQNVPGEIISPNLWNFDRVFLWARRAQIRSSPWWKGALNRLTLQTDSPNGLFWIV